MGGRKISEKVIVIGGSIAGKLAAKALSHFFREVIILEAGEEWSEKVLEKECHKAITPMCY